MRFEDSSEKEMHCCRLCPRECGADRTKQTGICGVTDRILVARAALHYWEEPCISGKNGSGAVFFTGCGLKCVYCQNGQISGIRQSGSALPGREVSVEKLASIFLHLQNEQHANNINLVTAVQYVPQAAEALRSAKSQGLNIPVVYNSSGYEKVSTLRMLEGLVDVWLPDFKYMDQDLARQYSHAPDYPERAKEAIAEMVRQAENPGEEGQRQTESPGAEGQRQAENPGAEGQAQAERSDSMETDLQKTKGTEKASGHHPEESGLRFYEKDGQTLMRRGVIVRHLLLPGHVKNAEAVVKYLHDTYGNRIYISMMNQYTPMEGLKEDPLLGRKVTKREYERLIDYAVGIGVENGFIQEGGTAKESFIPSFDGEGVE